MLKLFAPTTVARQLSRYAAVPNGAWRSSLPAVAHSDARRGYATEAGRFRSSRESEYRYSTGAEEKDLIVVGGGVAGYVAAIKAGQSGLKVGRRQAGVEMPRLTPSCPRLRV